MADYEQISNLFNPKLNLVLSTVSGKECTGRYLIFELTVLDPPRYRFDSCHRSQRSGLRQGRRLLKALVLNYLVFFNRQDGLWYWVKDGQLPPE